MFTPPQKSSDSVCAHDQIKRTQLLITSVKTLENEDCSTALASSVKEAEIWVLVFEPSYSVADLTQRVWAITGLKLQQS